MTDLAELRILTLEAIVDHCRNGMPVPQDVRMRGYPSGNTKLTLHFIEAAAVDTWAEELNLDVREDLVIAPDSTDPFRNYSAQRRGSPAWLGWGHVEAEAFLRPVEVSE